MICKRSGRRAPTGWALPSMRRPKSCLTGTGGPGSAAPTDGTFSGSAWPTRVEVFGRYKAGIHLIAGLGETEEQMVHAIAKAYRMGAMTHLFSFFPEGGSLLQHRPQPPLGKYRRIQLARYLINEGLADIPDIRFSR